MHIVKLRVPAGSHEKALPVSPSSAFHRSLHVQITILNMVPRRGFRGMVMFFAVLSSWAAAASGQKPAFVIGEKLAGSVGFYDADGKRLSGAKVGLHPHEIVLSP